MVVELGIVIKEVPIFIKVLRDYFFDLKTKDRDSRRVHIKFLSVHDILISNLVVIAIEELSEFKLYMRS